MSSSSKKMDPAGAIPSPADDPVQARAALIRQLCDHAPTASARLWLERYYALCPIEVLRARAPQDLARLALRHRELAQRRGRGEVLIDVQPPDPARGTEGAALATVDTCTDDMPFLVDTAAMAVREAGVWTDWTVHPVLNLRRDAHGELAAIEPSGAAESLIHFEIEPLREAQHYAALRASLAARFADLRLAVDDYPAMRERTRALIEGWTRTREEDAEDAGESRAFLEWLDQGHFTYLACAETRVETDDRGRSRFAHVPGAGLGLARAGARFADTDALIAPAEELARYVESARRLVVTKAVQRSPIHRDEFMDVISVKHFHSDGAVAGTTRLLGLFSAAAYLEPPWAIPMLRRKAERVVRRSGTDPDGHDGKYLREILHGLPRDELFQSNEDELFHTCMAIAALHDRHPLRLFLRRDRYGRFFSALVYLPRERYSRELRDHVAQELLQACHGQSIDRTVEFLRGGRTRIHYLVRTPPGTVLPQSAAEIERRLIELTRPWRERLRDALTQVPAVGLAASFGDAFTTAYMERTGAAEAAADVVELAQVSEQHRARVRLQLKDGCAVRLKLYTWRQSLALSDVLPTLENFGLRVIRQDPEPVRPAPAGTGAPALWVQDFEIEAGAARDLGPAQVHAFEAALIEVLEGAAEDDALNRLVLAAALDGRQVLGLRALARYINQIGLPYGRSEIEHIVAGHPAVARLVTQAFAARFDPAIEAAPRRELEASLARALDQALEQVEQLDADRVLRTLVSLVRAALRTNFWQRDGEGRDKPWVSIKLDPAQVPELPRPLPRFEIWVYAPNVEGVHLRGGAVARGGLRWSERREDFRTEVLGLMKAQNVKNAVIVPVGAKGGFVVKRGPSVADREAWQANGIDCYRTFLRGLLDLTDNRVGDRIEPPARVLRYDGDDPYLVVAADKGTATFSDIANAVAAEYGYWLGDAFASGGSAGYDHKKMGITARGAWESVTRHFRELGKDIGAEPFTVAGIGDMSGDVFGNGMLLSPQIRLVAAFDHRHIFLDPNPPGAAAFAERRRLFELPRSSWADYDPALISAGGGVYARTAKRLRLSPEARAALGTERATATTAEVVAMILRAPVDLLWNGGIGTYVKSSEQGHEQVRDRANDAVRVDGRELRARVVAEGGNLGFTQAGRVEYARYGAGGRGGRINTDAIDNSGGVHCSDREVNLKIPLNQLMREGRLARERRDALLHAMTGDVARSVLRDNQVQSACISLMEAQAPMRLEEHAALIHRLERDGLLDRALEGLPDDEELGQRRTQGQALTRPELAVLVAYAKLQLNGEALRTSLPDDPFFADALLGYFPPAMVAEHREALLRHRLRREIIATVLANALVNRMGASFAQRLADDHGRTQAEVLLAYVAAAEVFGGERYWAELEALDGVIPASTQYRLMHAAAALLQHASAWMLRGPVHAKLTVRDIVARYAPAVPQLESMLPAILPPSYRESFERQLAGLRGEQVPEAIALRIACSKALGGALDITDLALQASVTLHEAAGVYFQVGECLRIPWLLAAIVGLRVSGHWQALARRRLRDDTYRLHRGLAAQVLALSGTPVPGRLNAWIRSSGQRLTFSLGRLDELRATAAVDYASLAVAVRELYDLQSR